MLSTRINGEIKPRLSKVMPKVNMGTIAQALVAEIVTRAKQEIVSEYESLLSAYSGCPKGSPFNVHMNGVIEKNK